MPEHSSSSTPVQLGSVLLLQTHDNNGDNAPVSFASRSLTDVERRYSQTEKEALAVVWACEKYHLYLYGHLFHLITYHKPLKFIYSIKSKPSTTTGSRDGFCDYNHMNTILCMLPSLRFPWNSVDSTATSMEYSDSISMDAMACHGFH